MKYLAWGLNGYLKDYLDRTIHIPFDYIVDNDSRKIGGEERGISIVSFDMIDRQETYTVYVFANAFREIKAQIEKDHTFICHRLINVPFEESEEKLMKELPVFDGIRRFVEKNYAADAMEVCEQGYGREDYERTRCLNGKLINYERKLAELTEGLPNKRMHFRGYCSCCKKETVIHVEMVFGSKEDPAWSESAWCHECLCNSRMRFMADYTMNSVMPLFIAPSIYMYEQTTSLFKVISNQCNDVVGSEYLGADKEPGKEYNGIRHEDAHKLSFGELSKNILISCDVFEHVSDYKKAFEEAYRVLKVGGHFLFSIPLKKKSDHNVIRTIINEIGEPEFLLEPLYHLNPISEEGSLVYTDFGWDVLDDLKAVGFREVHFVTYGSIKKAYFGSLHLILEAVK